MLRFSFHLSRSSRWLTLSLAALSAGLALPAQAVDTLRVGRSQATPFSFTPIDIGIEKGIFSKHDLKIERAAFAGDAKMQQAMAANGIDIGVGSGPGMAFMAKGVPAKGVAAMAGPPLLLALVVRPDIGVNSAKDLKGKRLSCSSPSSLTCWLLREVSNRQGWGPDGIKRVTLGSPQAQIAALIAKKTDGFVTGLGSAYDLENKKRGKMLFSFGQYVKPFLIHVIFATDKIRKENPKAVTRFLAAWFETIDYMRHNKAETVRIANGIMRLPPDIASRVYDEVMPMFLDDGHFDPAAVALLKRSFVELGILDREPPSDALYTEALLPKK
jgi:ABC-type nitrate/sulfonate/bicarbonate transport system substrate-binding protein